LKKPLKIKFIGGGEEGLDQGGVQKEFFQILISKILDPNYGYFEYDKETRYSWFSRNSVDSLEYYQFFGLFLGLAVYNGVMLGVSFPRLFYKKILGEKITLEDIIEGFPVILNLIKRVWDEDCSNY
jgi:ubiquitin-protein ligase E3 A